MAKKNFSGGLESLLSGVATEQPTVSSTKNQEVQKVAKKEKTVETTSPEKQETTALSTQKDNTELIFAILGQYRISKLKAVAEKDKLSLEEVLKEAIDFYLEFQVEVL